MLLPPSSRLARSLLAAASLFLAASPALAAAPDKDTSAEAADAKKDAKVAKVTGDKAKPEKVAKKNDAKADKPDKKSDVKAGKPDKKSDAKLAKKGDAKADKAAKKDDAKLAKKDAAKAEKPDKKDDAKGKLAKKDDAKDAKKGPASIGPPNKGKLSGAIKLHSSRSLKVRDRSQVWGLPDLVKLLQRAAGKVAKRHPRSVMLVGDLSRKSGGEMTGHNSHQSGRDADVGFYVANSKGQPAAMTRFVAFDGTGKSAQVSWAQFDDERNWALVEALITDTVTPVRYVFVSSPLRARVLAFAAKKKVPKDVYTKAASVLLAPRDVDVHDDHFHVRIACPESMKGTCVEESLSRTPPAATKVAVAKANAKPAGGDDAKSAATDAKPAADPDPKVAAAPAAAPEP